jgi:hypothetical protein
MQTAAAAAAQRAAAAAGALAGQQQQQRQQQQQGLRMTSYRSGCLSKPGAVDILSALPAHSLTQLDLSFGLEGGGALDAAAVSAALARLSSLQQLRLSSAGMASITGNCLASVPQLSTLTSLAHMTGMFVTLRVNKSDQLHHLTEQHTQHDKSLP